ncbi:hypothetical protein [Streptomyces sp. KL116D]|uniref:hypothetical protein n=1 Tax=Streptomyces sp. KL116D TaxID=3045152 RepID=UPI0035562E46
MTTTPLDLDAIEARATAATPGPWCTDSWEIYKGAEYEAGAEWLGETCRAGEMDDSRADAEFVAHARTDVPALIAEVRRLRAADDRASSAYAYFESLRSSPTPTSSTPTARRRSATTPRAVTSTAAPTARSSSRPRCFATS